MIFIKYVYLFYLVNLFLCLQYHFVQNKKWFGMKNKNKGSGSSGGNESDNTDGSDYDEGNGYQDCQPQIIAIRKIKVIPVAVPVYGKKRTYRVKIAKTKSKKDYNHWGGASNTIATSDYNDYSEYNDDNNDEIEEIENELQDYENDDDTEEETDENEDTLDDDTETTDDTEYDYQTEDTEETAEEAAEDGSTSKVITEKLSGNQTLKTIS